MKSLASLFALGCALAAATPASAAFFSFSYTYDLSRQNTITVQGTFFADQIDNTSSYRVVGAQGTRSSTLSGVGDFIINGVAAVNSFNGNDNILTLFAPRNAGLPNF